MRRRPLAVAVLLACAAVVSILVLYHGRRESAEPGKDARDDPALGAPPPSLATRPPVSESGADAPPAAGSAPEPGVGAEVAPEDGPVLTVLAEDEGGRPVTVPVRVESIEGPASGETSRVLARADTDLDGRVTLQVPTRGPIVVRLEPENFGAVAPDPPEVRLLTPGGHVRFTMRPSCSVDVRAVDAATREAVTQFSVELLDAAGERKQSFGVSLATEADSSFEMSGGIGPGEYRVAMEAAGYRRWESDHFSFARFGESKALVAALERDMSTGTLSFLLSAPDGDMSGVGSATVVVLVRERGREDARWALPLGGGTLAEVGPRGPVVSCRCPTGTYDAIAWLGKPRRAGVAEGFSVRAGLENEVRVVLRPGIDVAVSALVPAGESAKEIRLDAVGEGTGPATERLPLVWIHGGGAVSWGQSGGAYNAPAVLGPYPFVRVRASVRLGSGERRETLLPPP